MVEVPISIIKAYDEGFADLDVRKCAESFGAMLLSKRSQLSSNLILDLRRCSIEYGLAHFYLDKLLDASRPGGVVGRLEDLAIKTNYNYGNLESITHMFFQISNAIDSGYSDKPIHVKEKLNNFCINNNLQFKILIYKHNKIADDDEADLFYSVPDQGV